MTEAEFDAALAERGMRVIKPESLFASEWGLVDIGCGLAVNRWSSPSQQFDKLFKFLCYEQDRLVGKPKAKPTAKPKAKPTAKADGMSGESLRKSVGKALQAKAAPKPREVAPRAVTKQAKKTAAKPTKGKAKP